LISVVDLARDLNRLNGFEADEIPIVFSGIRPGEKLTEELWEEDAKVDETAHKDIFRVTEADRSAAPSLLPRSGPRRCRVTGRLPTPSDSCSSPAAG
jgi:FlaA1/EpsC-like NDP-sugar epimerase